MTTRTVNPLPSLEQLHDGQRAILKSWARCTAASAGTGGGKTVAGYLWLHSRMKVFPGEAWMVALPDFPTLQQTLVYNPDPDRPPLLEFLKAVGERPVYHISDKVLECASGTVFMRSAENVESWEGGHLKGAWLDEYDYMRVEAFRVAMRRTAMREGWVLLTGTPRHVRWVRQEVWDRWKGGDPAFNVIQFPSTANPRYRPTAMEEARRLLPDWLFRRMHLGELAAEEGGSVFRRQWWHYLDERPLAERTFQAWDTAYKEKTSADYSSCVTLQFFSGGFFVADVWRAKVEYPELKRAAEGLYRKWRPAAVLVEDASSGQSLIQDLRRTTNMPVIPVPVDRDKYTKAAAVTGLVEAGQVHLPSSAPWLHDFIEELAAFPGGDHDDQVDAFVMALSYAARRGGGWKVWA